MQSHQVVATIIVVLAICAAHTVVEAKRSKKFKMHFYMHDLVDQKNLEKATTALVAGPNNNVTDFNQFGSVVVFDDLLTEGPLLNSTLVGRAQGLHIGDSMSSFNLFITFTAVFKDKHNGSTISFHGQDADLNPIREIAIVGRTGDFRFVTGYAQIRTYEFTPPNLLAILSVEVFLKQDSW